MTGGLWVVSVVLLLAGAWTRAAGSAIRGVPRADALREESDGVKGAGVVAELLDERETITPAVGVVSSSFLVLATTLALTALPAGDQSASIVSGLLIAAAVIVVGDLIPRAIGRARASSVAYRSSKILQIAVRLGGRANALFPMQEPRQEHESPQEAEDVEGHERELIDSVLEFSETIVREVMTPRPDMTTIPVTAAVEELIDVATLAGYSRVPVTSNGDVVGHVIVKDLLSMITNDARPSSVAEVMRPIDFVPETKLASALLAEMQEGHAHQVIVVDEYGDVAGLVTIEDLLEELVGEIADETDDEESMVEATGDGWDVDARLPVDDLIKITGVSLPEHQWDTVGGLILALAERVPVEGEEFEYQELVLRVKKMQGRRVSEVAVTKAHSEAV